MPVVALSQVHCKELKSIFSQEIKSWQNELFWDYQPTVALIKKYITSKSLSGYAIKTTSGKILGYSYYIINKPVGYIGNIYILSESANPTTYTELLNRIIGTLESNSSILRIEGHLFTFNCNLTPFFKSQGFNTIKRHFLSKTINSKDDNEQTLALPAKIRLVKWQNFFYTKAAETIYDSYQNSPDYDLCYDYQSPQGCTRFLLNLLNNPSCGIFSPETSLIALNSNGIVCGILMTSTTDLNTGMVTQISVKRSHQGTGIGSALLETYFKKAKKRGVKRVTLSVSEINHRSNRLYLRLGFQKIKDIYAFTRP